MPICSWCIVCSEIPLNELVFNARFIHITYNISLGILVALASHNIINYVIVVPNAIDQNDWYLSVWRCHRGGPSVPINICFTEFHCFCCCCCHCVYVESIVFNFPSNRRPNSLNHKLIPTSLSYLFQDFQNHQPKSMTKQKRDTKVISYINDMQFLLQFVQILGFLMPFLFVFLLIFPNR